MQFCQNKSDLNCVYSFVSTVIKIYFPQHLISLNCISYNLPDDFQSKFLHGLIFIIFHRYFLCFHFIVLILLNFHCKLVFHHSITSILIFGYFMVFFESSFLLLFCNLTLRSPPPDLGLLFVLCLPLSFALRSVASDVGIVSGELLCSRECTPVTLIVFNVSLALQDNTRRK